MSYNYVVTAHKPTNVTHSAVGNFTSPEDMNLIVAKCTRVEIYQMAPEGLHAMLEVAIYGRIATLELFKPPGAKQDLLFICTERYTFCVLAYDAASGELVTKAGGDVQDRIGRPVDNGQIGIVDPECRLVGLHLYDGLFKVIPIDGAGDLQDAFNIRLEELNVITIRFLHGCPRPTIAVLYQDTKSQKHIRTYAISLEDKEFVQGPWHHNNLDMGANMVIAVPAPLGGAIVIGEQTIMYFDGRPGGEYKVIPMRQTITKACGQVDADGSRYLLSDITGTLHLLALVHAGDKVRALKLEPLGKTSIGSTLSYLDNGVVFVGSSCGDSQLVRLSATPVGEAKETPGAARDGEPTKNYLEVLDTFTNLGPIVDFCVVDLEHHGQGQVVTCSGVYQDGSLRVIRNGIGIDEQASVDLPGVKGLFSLGSAGHDSHLVVTFVGETRVLGMTEDDELDEAEVPGFEAQAQTLFCANVGAGGAVQVTPREVRLVEWPGGALLDTWQAPQGAHVTMAACTDTQVLAAVSDCGLHYLEVRGGRLCAVKAAKMQAEVSCVDLGEGESSQLCCVGLWDASVATLSLPSLQPKHAEPLGVDVIPRSLLLSRLEGVLYALVALGDGHLFHYRVDEQTCALCDRKKVSLGTQPISLRRFLSGGQGHVFAASDRPTVVYSSNRKLLYSNVNLREVSHAAPFHAKAFPGCLALIQDQTLMIGTIDQIQKLHIRTVPLGEQPRRICHQRSSHTFGVLTVRYDFAAASEDNEVCFVTLVDDGKLEVQDKFQLERYEAPCSILSCRFDGDEQDYYMVGTAFALPDETEPNKGRVIAFKVSDGGKLEQVACKEVKGAVYNLTAFHGKLLAGINSKVQLMRWDQLDNGDRDLVNECSKHNHILALYVETRGDFIVVGDLMKSVSLLVYKQEEGAIEDLACDFNSNWMTAVHVLDDDLYLGAENSFNLFAVKRNSDCASDEDRQRLEVCGQYHLGEFVNRFREGSLVMQLPDADPTPGALGAPQTPQAHKTRLFGTVNGVIGVVATLPAERGEVLRRLQTCLTRVIRGVGGFSHEAWRSFYNERKTEASRAFVDGDLVESFLDLPRDKAEQVASMMQMGQEEVAKMVEELARLH